MLIILNPNAAGGTAMKKWNKINRLFRQSTPPFIVHTMNGKANSERFILSAIRNGETDFVAGGGDGTVNLILNFLLKSLSDDQKNTIRFGAIGLGSSNDFHKPFNKHQFINDIPFKIDFDNAKQRDIGMITFNEDGKQSTKYFLTNSSAGVTADANRFFNQPDDILKNLKRFSAPLAILYAAFKTVLTHRNIEVTITSDETGHFKTSLSNIAILKNPYFSGSLRFSSEVKYDDGRFDIHLSQGMDKLELVSLLWKLSTDISNNINKMNSWSTRALIVSSRKPFNIEFDGEIIETTSAQFQVLPQYLKVCQ